MKVSSIGLSQKNPKFNANIKFVEKGAKNLLSSQSMEILSKKAQNVGRNTDIITVYLLQKKTDDYVLQRENSLEHYTEIIGEFGNESPFCYPYRAEVGKVYGDEQEKRDKAFVLVDHFINTINNALKR